MTQVRAYLDWLVASALPTWAFAGFDPLAGRFRERLDEAGRPLDVPHRAMVQARQCYVYAHAAQLGWFPEGGRLAETAMASLLRDFLDEGPASASIAFSIASNGAIVSDVRDAYAHAFILFALAWTYRLNGDPRLLALADKVIAFLENEMTDPDHGGLFDALPVALRDKRQNPHMHLLEAYLFLERAAPGRGYLERAGRLVALFERSFFRASPGVLLEYFGEDWAAHPDPARAGLWEPGHHFEWVWLLADYGALAGVDTARWTTPLYDNAVAHGLAANGLLMDEVTADLVPARRSHRLWPHTEAIKAATVRAAAGDPDAPAFAERMAGALTAHFVGRPFAGGWTDQLAPDGDALVDYVPASSLYHLFLAGAEAARAFPDAARTPEPA